MEVGVPGGPGRAPRGPGSGAPGPTPRSARAARRRPGGSPRCGRGRCRPRRYVGGCPCSTALEGCWATGSRRTGPSTPLSAVGAGRVGPAAAGRGGAGGAGAAAPGERQAQGREGDPEKSGAFFVQESMGSHPSPAYASANDPQRGSSVDAWQALLHWRQRIMSQEGIGGLSVRAPRSTSAQSPSRAETRWLYLRERGLTSGLSSARFGEVRRGPRGALTCENVLTRTIVNPEPTIYGSVPVLPCR